MANSSILAAFERMWQHVTAALNNKSDLNHSHDEFNSMSSDKADAVKKASGETVSLTNSVHTPLYGFKLYGKTTQNGTPTPEAPVELVSAGDDGNVGVSVYGRNLFNEAIMLNADGWKYENGFYTGDNTELRTFFKNNPLNIFRPNTRYYFSFWGYSAEASKNSRIYIYYTDGTLFDITGLRNTDLTFCEYVTDKGKSVSHIMIDYADSATIYLRDFMICESQTATDYEPYKAFQTLSVSTPNGLAGIPVTSGGNYTDSNGQRWICDEVDFARGVYVQRVKRLNLAIADMNNADTHAGWKDLDITDCVDTNTFFKHGIGMLNNIGKDTNINYSARTIFFGSVSSGELSQTEWKELYPNLIFVLLIPLITPIETSLSTEQLAAYASLHTNEPNTTIMNDGNAGMEVKYYTTSTAVQMVHSPLDEGKILSIDEHGCVVLSELAIDGYATETYVDEKVASLVDAAPEALNTLNELAAALGDDENFATTVTNQIAAKQDAITGVAGQFVVIGEDGNPTTRTIPYAEEATF